VKKISVAKWQKDRKNRKEKGENGKGRGLRSAPKINSLLHLCFYVWELLWLSNENLWLWGLQNEVVTGLMPLLLIPQVYSYSASACNIESKLFVVIK